MDIQITKDKIYNKMISKGYVSVNDSTYQKSFSKDFKEYYTEEFLNYIGFNFDISENDSWIRYATTRKKSISDPIKYLSAIRYLFGSFKSFYEYEDRHSIFKYAPYPCLNKVCPNYNKLVINDCSTIILHNHPLTTFKYEYCGFIYSRRGPDKEDGDIYKKNYVKDYGHIWLKKLKECVEEGVSLRQMSKLLGCRDISTIKKHVEKIKSSVLIKNDVVKITSQESIVAEDDLFLVQKYKFMFLELLSENPKMNALSIYRKHPKAYKLVSKYDREWIENNLLKQKHTQGSNSNKVKKYWRDKDKYLYEKLIRSLDKVKAKQELYERITIALLQKYIGYYNLHQNKGKLPRCFKLINIECETIIDYQKRRINYAMKEMEYSGIKVTFAKILHKAGLRNKINQEVISYIREMMKKM